MKVSSICNTPSACHGRTIGTIAGLGVGSAYIIKNHKALFEHSMQEALKANKGTAIGKIVPIAVSAGFIGAATAIGRLAGKCIGKIVDNHYAKKFYFKNSEKA